MTERVRSLAEVVLARHEAELVDAQVKVGRTRLVRIVADRAGGIDIDTCARVSEELSRMLDVEDPIPGTYTLEVTSPGADRPLRDGADFRRNLGRKVRVWTDEGETVGVVGAVDDETLWLDRDADRTAIPLEKVSKATVVLPW